ncbi:methyltransferase domain-containing protein [Actinomadura alba]|uniref:Protein-L-isoaspartate O-methyltransferase n=2 Tax=Actinomadura alba TaxID=406431 RepID=A0ABR7LMP7_9ACTN|nr:methyltransferase domain-containing protein [Actinomadura alba]
MHQAPRHLFLPESILAGPPGGPDGHIDHTQDPNGWWDAAYSDAAIVTQLDDGATDISAGAGDYTSSCSAPTVVIEFLKLLYVHDHQRVLEIGTGTGWTAALLSARLGADNVISVEVDATVAKQAEMNLHAAGFAPHLVVGDGTDGWPEGAPYDRVHVTCGVRDIPYAWVEQTRPGGIIVLPWSPGIAFGHQVRLDVQRDGTAIGRLTGSAGYMLLRSQRPAAGACEGDAATSTTAVDPRSIVWDSYGVDAALAGQLPGVLLREDRRDDGSVILWCADADGSWATAEYQPGAVEFPVIQHGDRCLWDEVEDAYFRWQSWGRPVRDRFGLTVLPDGQHMWLDSPANVVVTT